MPPLLAPEPPLSDGVVVLRPWRDEDVGELVALFNEPTMASWARAPSPYREADALELITAAPLLAARGESLALAVAAVAGPPIGSISLRLHPDGRGECGYAIAARSRRRGFATRALRLLCGWAFETVGLARLEVLAQPDNRGSLLVAEGAGFRREGLLRSYRQTRYGRVDLVMLALLRDERPS